MPRPSCNGPPNVTCRPLPVKIPQTTINMLKATGIAETALYVDDLERAESFYTSLFGFSVIKRDDRLRALRIVEGQVLLLFRRQASVQPVDLGFGVLPGHDGAGPLHVCLGIAKDDLAGWEEKLRSANITVESRIQWPAGGTSLYFRDPDGHVVELATPGLWA